MRERSLSSREPLKHEMERQGFLPITGLNAESIPALILLFPQVSSAIHHAEGDLGIGLAQGKGLVRLHGGTVEVRRDGL